MTIEDMCRGVSKIRNHVIARVFRELNLIEQWGSGIPRILREAQELGLPDLQITEIGMRVRVTVFLSERITIPKATEQVTEQVTRILDCLSDAPLGAREIMKMLGLRHRPTFLYDYFQPALNASLVEMTHPESPKSPTQKYRLTAKGKSVHAGNK